MFRASVVYFSVCFILPSESRRISGFHFSRPAGETRGLDGKSGVWSVECGVGSVENEECGKCICG